MLYRICTALVILAGHAHATAANNYPVVMVHGFLGFGPEQYTRTGFKYWGGFDDIVDHMRQHHGRHQVWAASVGPISASWDRAAELYYQIKGGCLDYGSHHKARYRHNDPLRLPEGRCWATDPANNPNRYPLALYPEWDADHPIHLIGHSQGGQTIRILIELLENGSPNGDEGGAELYTGGKIGWVASATTLSAPHDGTSLRDAIGYFAPKAAGLAQQIDTMASGGARPDGFLLRYVGGARRKSETAAAYRKRLMSIPQWNQDNYDAAQYEMGPDGARKFNAWVKTSPHVYYFSISNGATEAGAPCCNGTDRAIAPVQKRRYQYARRDMAPLTKPYAGEWIVPSAGRRGMGSYTQAGRDRVPVDGAWFANDGVVNTSSMRAPFGQPLREYDGVSVRGTWNFLQHYPTYDHFDMIGWPRSAQQAYPIYDMISAIIYAL